MLRYPEFISAIMSRSLANLVTAIVLSTTALSFTVQANALLQSIEADYQDRLEDFFIDFHANPELSTVEHRTAKKLAEALRATGFDVTEGVGGTGIVALLKNGSGPLVMMRGDIDGLPIQEQSGLPYASKVIQKDPFSGKEVPVMHACGHDVHITSLIGIAKQMAEVVWGSILTSIQMVYADLRFDQLESISKELLSSPPPMGRENPEA